MGNHPSTQLIVSLPSRPNEWVVENRTQYCQLVRNTYTHQTAEQYIVPTPPGITLFNNLAQYQYRRTHHTNTVAVYHVEKQQGAYLCNGQDYLKVRIQRTPIRLSQMKGVSEVEGIKVTLKMMEGFKILFEHFGGFHINDQMIGFNQKGEVKVWINSNFALNSVEFSPNLGNKVVSQADMVNQIFSLVQEHLQSQTFSNQFKESVLRKYPRTFDEAINLILMSQNKSSLNSSIKSIHQVKQAPMHIQTVSQQNLNRSFRKAIQPQQAKVTQNKSSFYQNTSSTSSFYQSQQRSVLHNPPSTIAKSRLINSPSNQNTQNIMFNHREPRHNFQQKIVKKQPEVISRIQPNYQNEIIQEKSMNTHRSLIPKPQKVQQYIPVKPTLDKETRRHSLKSFKIQQNLINQNNRLRQTQNFIDKSIPKQFSSIDSTPNLNKMQSSSLKIPSTQQLKVSHKVVEVAQKNNFVHPVSSPQPKAPQFKFPKPSAAVQRMVIQKVEKNPQNAELQIMNAMNNISGISSQHSRTISKFSTDQILGQIHHPFVQPHIHSPNNYVLSPDLMASSRTGLVLKEVYQTKTINSRSKYNLEDNIHDQFSKTKITPSTYDDKSDPSIKQRTITTPKFQSHTSSNEVNSNNLLSTDIQKLIEQHQADKKELLKKIQQYERVSRLNRINYDVSPAQPKQYQQTNYQRSKPSLSNKNIGIGSHYKDY